ncbi:glycerate kinase [Lentzea flava]|uniref:Glycerate kinase n=1 Tax=Lentzea flava TaxID=103732 RepID=A0ABQ2UN07_9PSEU|nr:glycerate kinase [Lentzea flava]MCP2200546.1 glycerate kinase [Lentzea flava]GGU43413.1 glycerate kinase [Lentzea flava]
MRVLIAPDSFKGTIDAVAAANRLAEGWRLASPCDEIWCLPLADGGEGTVDVLPQARRVPVQVIDAIGRPRTACWSLLAGGTAVVELAVACGLPLLPAPDPLGASTFGFGQLLRSAAGHPGVTRIVAALGGSASTDGGSGALAALGARLFTEDGSVLPRGGAALRHMARADLTELISPPSGGVVCLADVSTPLLGPTGAAHRFGPQKGAGLGEILVLEDGLRRWASVLGGDPDAAGAGAAGGTTFGLVQGWGATAESGSRFVADLVGLESALRWADLVITGEGRLDEQSWTGKVVGNVVASAQECDVALVVGERACELPAGVRQCVSLVEMAGDPALALAEPGTWLRVAGRTLAEGMR